MDKEKISDLNIVTRRTLPTPESIIERFPLTPSAHETVSTARSEVKAIIADKDPRRFIVIGPCSIHDTKAALEYAERLKALAERVKDQFVLVMRTYFEKPRTSVGWKGFINDPYLDGSFLIEEGLAKARELLLKISDLGVPVATEALDPITPQYLDDLFAWTAIGARTTESQTHREMASGLSAPVGFKNTTDGSISAVINALKAVRNSHHFIGINKQGQCSVYQTSGNPFAHTVLRGGTKPNYDAESIKACEAELEKNGVSKHIMVDCSHGNSNKDARNQPKVFESCIEQILNGNKNIRSFMVESNLNFGAQSIPEDISMLEYGVSVTDACIDWQTTENMILKAAQQLSRI
jgi:3-deoxy-7-phosphoheptulonate synthase